MSTLKTHIGHPGHYMWPFIIYTIYKSIESIDPYTDKIPNMRGKTN